MSFQIKPFANQISIYGDYNLKTLREADAESFLKVIDESRENFNLIDFIVPHFKTLQEIKTTIHELEKYISENKGVTYGLWNKNDLIGFVAVKKVDWDERTAEIGFWLSPFSEKKELARDALRSLNRHLFIQIGLIEITAVIANNNLSTQSVLVEIGFEWIKSLPAPFEIYSEKKDSGLYSLIHDELLTNPLIVLDEQLREVPTDPTTLSKLVKLAEERVKTTKDSTLLIRRLEGLGFACRCLSELDKSEKYFQKSYVLSLADPRKQLQNLIRLAHVYQWKHQKDKARSLFDLGRSILNEFEVSETLRAAYHQHLGKFYFDQKFYGLATTEFELALKIRKNVSAPTDQIESSQTALSTAMKNWQHKSPQEIKIRRSQISDAESIHNAHMTSINQICSKDHNADEIRVWGGRTFDPNMRFPGIKEQFHLVVEYKEKIEGFCQLQLQFKEGKQFAHLYGLYITPTVLKKGIGHDLINLAFDYCTENKVIKITLGATFTAHQFYKNYGFIDTGEVSSLKMNGVDVRYFPMEKWLD